MALVACSECGKEISSEAKNCPQCGAKNKNRSKTKAPGWLVIVALVGLVWWIASIYSGTTNPGGNLPTCSSSEGGDLFKKTFEGSPFAQANKFRVVDIADQMEVSAGSRPEDRICEATFLLNNGEKITYTFRYEANPREGFLVRGEPK